MSIFRDLGVRDGKDRLKEGMLYNLAACYVNAERRIAQTLAPFGLSPVKMNALLMIRHAAGGRGLSQSELCKKMIVSAGNITRLVDRLEKEGLAGRSSVKDRRVKLLQVTPKASALLDKAWPVYKKEINRIASLVPEKEVARVNAVLDKIRCKLADVPT